MLTSKNSKGEIVFSFESEKDQKPFYCPSCDNETILRKGEVKIHHFAHKKTINCFRGGESQLHLKSKINIYRKMQKIFNNNVHLEYNLFKDFVPDVYVNINKPMAFEIQHSSLTVEEIKRRTNKYISNNIKVYWIFPIEDLKINKNSYSGVKLNRMQLFTYKLYKGSVYGYDIEDNKIYKIKLGNTYNESQYYTEFGEFKEVVQLRKTVKTIDNMKELWRTN